MTRYFLGWDRPVADVAAEFLLRGISGTPLDLGHLMVVVPTRQAGRRLRERLADAARARGTMVLSPGVVQPSHFFRPRGGVASRAECLAVFADILRVLDYAQYGYLFPGTARDQAGDFRWRLETAQLLLDLRSDLCEGGHTVATASERLQAEPNFPEPERWQELLRLEKAFLGALAQQELSDPVRAQIEAAETPSLPERVERLVIVGVPDPVPLAVRAWERLDKGGKVTLDVCIHAPKEQQDRFDDWGRPARPYWLDCPLQVQDEYIQMVPKPPDQADAARRLLPAQLLGAVSGTDDRKTRPNASGLLALGVLDSEVMPHIEAAMQAAGVSVADPALKPVTRHALYDLVRDLLNLAETDAYDDFSALLRNPHLLRYLERYEGGVTAEYLLGASDRLQNEHIPASFTVVREWSESPNAQTGDSRYGTGLEGVCRLIAGWLERLRSPDWPAELRDILASVYSRGANAERQDGARGLRPVAEALQSVLEAMNGRVIQRLVRADAGDRREFFLRLFAEQTYPDESPEPRVDLEGWLELHWNDAPLLVLTGFNEGRVPASIVGHAFLPDSARRLLGLPDNDSRLARDSYLLTAMLAFRSTPGAVQIILGKTMAEGDALKPSRLLFRCRDNQTLADRAVRLFGKPSAALPAPFVIAPEWRLRVPSREPPANLSVTMLKEYLACPFRFYLKYVLRMEEADDLKRELDAMDFGNVCHRALQRFAENAALRDSTNATAIADFLAGEAQAIVREEFGRDLSAALALQVGSMEQRLRRAARVQASLREQGWEIQEVNGRYSEHDMTLELGGLTVRARIDRIDRNEETNQYRILDYKTSDAGKPPSAVHLIKARDGMPPWRKLTVGDKLKAWSELQLPLYWLIGQQQLGSDRIVCGYFNLPKAVTETAVAEFTELDDTMRQSAQACAEGVVAAIRAGTYWPPVAPPEGWTDTFERLCRGNWQDAFEFTASSPE